jgi:hypothetical protein
VWRIASGNALAIDRKVDLTKRHAAVDYMKTGC